MTSSTVIIISGTKRCPCFVFNLSREVSSFLPLIWCSVGYLQFFSMLKWSLCRVWHCFFFLTLLLVSSCESGWKTTGWVLYLGRTLPIIGTRSCSCWDQCLLIGDAGTCRLSLPLSQWPSASLPCAETSYPPTSTSALTPHSLSSLNLLQCSITNNK